MLNKWINKSSGFSGFKNLPGLICQFVNSLNPKLNKYNSGYTLIEILVGINLIFILITILLAMYLFTVKFSSSTLKKFDNKIEITNFLSRLITLLERSEDFYFVQNDSSTMLIINEIDTIQFGNNLISNNYLNEETEVEDYVMIIRNRNGSTASFEQGKLTAIEDDWENINLIKPYEVNEVFLRVTKQNETYQLKFVNPFYGIKAFKNN